MKSNNILDAIGMIDDELIFNAKNNTVKLKSKRKLLLCVAVITIILFTTALAINLGWHLKLIEYLKPNEKQISMLNQASNISEVTASDNGVTVTVKQTLADKFGIYVLYEITAPENFKFNDDTVWSIQVLELPYEKTDDYIVGGTSRYEILEQNQNKRLVLIYQDITSPLASGKLCLNLSNLHDRITNENKINCQFKLEWNFTYKDTGKNIEVNQKFGDNTIKNIYISPISLCVYIEGYISPKTQPIVKFKDGSEISYSPEAPNVSFTTYLIDEQNSTYMNKISFRFDKVIDIDNVKYIKIANVKIDV